MSRRNSCRNGSKGFVKTMTVDMPVSSTTFDKYFGIYCKEMSKKHSGYKICLTIEEMSSILGLNWHIVAQKNTTTHQRVIGDVSIHYRPKYTRIFDNSACPR